jgi:hypothetical protein
MQHKMHFWAFSHKLLHNAFILLQADLILVWSDSPNVIRPMSWSFVCPICNSLPHDVLNYIHIIWKTYFSTIRDWKSSKQHVTLYYCIPLEHGLRTETCSGSNDRTGEGGLLRWWYHSESNYLINHTLQNANHHSNHNTYFCWNFLKIRHLEVWDNVYLRRYCWSVIYESMEL